MSAYITRNIETVFDTQGQEAAQARYRAWFISTPLYTRYKADADAILNTDGYSACIVTA